MNSIPYIGGTPVKTLIVDDAPLMRKAIHRILSDGGDIEVIGMASNGQECLDRIHDLNPDVVTLDIDMPVMNGITTVKNIMVRHPVPIVIISSMIQDGYFAFEALRLGVMDFVPKPSRAAGEDWVSEEELFAVRVRMASSMQINRVRRVKQKQKGDQHQATPTSSPPPYVVVMGTTLAGPNTVIHIVSQLPPDFSGAIVALQEIHPRILVPFCRYFSEISSIPVVPVTGSSPLVAGSVYMCSTFSGTVIKPSEKNPSQFVITTTKPSKHPLDQLFESAADCLRPQSLWRSPNGCGQGRHGGNEEGKRGGRLHHSPAAGLLRLSQPRRTRCPRPSRGHSFSG